jgi:hypothetical protein
MYLEFKKMYLYLRRKVLRSLHCQVLALVLYCSNLQILRKNRVFKLALVSKHGSNLSIFAGFVEPEQWIY